MGVAVAGESEGQATGCAFACTLAMHPCEDASTMKVMAPEAPNAPECTSHPRPAPPCPRPARPHPSTPLSSPQPPHLPGLRSVQGQQHHPGTAAPRAPGPCRQGSLPPRRPVLAAGAEQDGYRLECQPGGPQRLKSTQLSPPYTPHHNSTATSVHTHTLADPHPAAPLPRQIHLPRSRPSRPSALMLSPWPAPTGGPESLAAHPGQRAAPSAAHTEAGRRPHRRGPGAQRPAGGPCARRGREVRPPWALLVERWVGGAEQ